MDEANSTAIVAALRDAPVIVWSVPAISARASMAPGPTTLPLADVTVIAGAPHFAAFAKASPQAWDALMAATGGVAQTRTTQDDNATYHTYYRPIYDATQRITGASAVTTILPQSQQSVSVHRAERKTNARIALHQNLLDVLIHAPVAVSLMLREGDALVIAFANPSYEALMNHGPLVGRKVADVFAEELKADPAIATSLRAVTEDGAGGQTLRERCITHEAGAQARYVDFVYEPVFDTYGKACGLTSYAYEVTSQVVARQNWEASKSQLRTLADSMPQIVWTTDARGVVQYYNAQWYAYTGFDPAHIANNSWMKIHHSDDLPGYTAAWQTAFQTASPFTHEGRMFDRQTRAYRWFLHRALPSCDASGQVVQWFGSSTDIDNQKRGQDQVDNILESINDAFFAVDANWTITRVNAKLEHVSQMSRQHQLGRNFLDVYFPEPESRTSKYCVSYFKAMTERVSVSFEDYYEALDLWTDVNVYPSADGGLAVFFRNSTKERKLTQNLIEEKHKFEAVFVDSPACMALLRGPTFIFEKVNPKYSELMGHRDLVGKPLEVALPELIGQPFKMLMQQVLATGKPYIASEMAVRLIRTIGKDPENCFFDFTYSRVDDARGQAYGIYIHATDITEKVLVRRKTERLADSLTAAVQARDEFLSIASHELKTPVTSLKMQLQMTRRAVKPEENQAPLPTKLAKTLDLCCRQVDRLTALIEDLLDVSRVESGKMSFNFEKLEIGRLVDEVVDRFGEQLKMAGCTVDTHYSEEMWVQCDGFRIEQVITNLLSNALKYGAGTPVRIEASIGADNGARIVVRDEGMGIAKDKQSKVFDRFERAISHNNVSGLGLGLYISKQIVEAHHGHIFVESELGHGSTFTVELPQDASLGQHAVARKVS